MTQKNRLKGGLINRNNTRKFEFNGQSMQGFEGDTLASALLANDIRLVGRSFKYHRPRGMLSAGSEEPNALVELRTGNRKEPNSRATTTELYDGLVANPQNCWPSLNFDFLGVNDLLAPFLTAGFYYKTFMWPSVFWEKVYEPVIRRAAGLGSASLEPDPDCYDKGFLHADLLIIGAGPSGLLAALTAAKSGVRVIIVDEDFVTGGRLNAENYILDEQPGSIWAKGITDELSDFDNVKVLTRTTVIGAFDHGIYGAVERVSDHLKTPVSGKPRQILWRIYTKQAILCSGATERSIVFENNDRPGIMLAGAIRNYVNRWAVTPSQNVAIFTNNNDGHQTARALLNKGVNVVAVIDTRNQKVKSPDYETFSDFKTRVVKIEDTNYNLKYDDLIYANDTRVKTLQLRYWNEIDDFITEEIKKKDIKHSNAQNLSALKLTFLKKLLHEIKTNKLSVMPDSLPQNKADPYNERQTVDVDVDVEYKDPNKKEKNKKSRYGSW